MWRVCEIRVTTITRNGVYECFSYILVSGGIIGASFFVGDV